MTTELTFPDINIGFKKISKEAIGDLEKYFYKVMASDKAQMAGDNFKIRIGVDSEFVAKQSHWNARYMITIAFTYGNQGTHLIFKEDVIKGKWSKRLELDSRLWREAQLAGDLGLWIKETLDISPEIHLDINPNKKYKSNILYDSAKGYITGLGFEVQLKPDASIASCAADHFFKSK